MHAPVTTSQHDHSFSLFTSRLLPGRSGMSHLPCPDHSRGTKTAVSSEDLDGTLQNLIHCQLFRPMPAYSLRFSICRTFERPYSCRKCCRISLMVDHLFGKRGMVLCQSPCTVQPASLSTRVSSGETERYRRRKLLG